MFFFTFLHLSTFSKNALVLASHLILLLLNPYSGSPISSHYEGRTGTTRIINLQKLAIYYPVESCSTAFRPPFFCCYIHMQKASIYILKTKLMHKLSHDSVSCLACHTSVNPVCKIHAYMIHGVHMFCILTVQVQSHMGKINKHKNAI